MPVLRGVITTVMLLCCVLEVRSQVGLTFQENVDLLGHWMRAANEKDMYRHLSAVRDSIETLVTRNIGRNARDFPPKSYNISNGCITDILHIIDGLVVGEQYALKMADAMAKPESGILQGNLVWLGSYSECRQINPESLQNGSWVEPFQTRYCTVSITNVTSYKPAAAGAPTSAALVLGVCVPDTCDEEDVRALVNSALYLLPPNIEAAASQCQTDRGERTLDPPAIGVICMLSVLALLILCGSTYDLLSAYQARSVVVALPVADDRQNSSVNDDVVDDSAHNDSNQLLQNTNLEEDKSSRSAVCSRLLMAFSVFNNGEKLLSTGPTSESNLAALHGIRFLSMSWVILGHNYVFPMSFLRNPVQFLQMVKRFTFQAILNATVSVDSFFVLSGALASYLLLREISSKGGPRRVSWWKFYIHRYWRLTPPYMLVLGTYVALLKYTGEGPVWPKEIEPNCPSSWWTNLLYINNLVNVDKQCFGWSWYLANDMQFFLISPLLVVPFVFSSIAGVLVNMAFLLASLIATGVITERHGYPADLPSYVSDQTMLDKSAGYMRDVYIKPWCRIGPYVIGVLVGYLLHRTKRVVKIHWIISSICWVIAAVLNTSVLYGLYNVANGHTLSSGVNAFYAAVHRSVWALGLGWVIFACCTGHGGPVNRFLSWAAFVPLSRLSYMAYLIHPIIMSYYYFNLETTIILTDINMIYIFLAHMVVTYGIAFVVSLAFEAPMIGLEKVLLRRN